jgi:hypothetical protein
MAPAPESRLGYGESLPVDDPLGDVSRELFTKTAHLRDEGHPVE